MWEAPIWGARAFSKVSKARQKWGEADVPECECERRFQAEVVAVMPNWLMTLINIAGATTLIVLSRL